MVQNFRVNALTFIIKTLIIKKVTLIIYSSLV